LNSNVEPGQQDSKMLEGSMHQSRVSGGTRNPFSGAMSNTQSVTDTSNLKGKIVSLEVGHS